MNSRWPRFMPALLIGFCLTPLVALAQTPSPTAAAEPASAAVSNNPFGLSKDWQISVGGAFIATPRYIGGKGTRFLAVPSFDVRYKDWFFANVQDGIGLQYESKGLTLSAALAPDFNNRDPTDSPRLSGLRKVSEAVAVKLKAEYEAEQLDISATLTSRLGSSRKGGNALELEAGYTVLGGSNYFLALGVRVRAVDAQFANNFIGITPQDAAASGRSAFRVGSGVTNVGPYGQFVYRLDGQWTLISRLALDKLRGQAAKSPLVEKTSQPSFLLVASYTY